MQVGTLQEGRSPVGGSVTAAVAVARGTLSQRGQQLIRGCCSLSGMIPQQYTIINSVSVQICKIADSPSNTSLKLLVGSGLKVAGTGQVQAQASVTHPCRPLPAFTECMCEVDFIGQAYQTALEDFGSLQSHSDAVREDEGQHHIVKELMGYNRLTQQPEPEREREGERERERKTERKRYG